MDYFNKLQKYFICFVLYAVLGWSYEVILDTFIYQWVFTNGECYSVRIVRYME